MQLRSGQQQQFNRDEISKSTVQLLCFSPDCSHKQPRPSREKTFKPRYRNLKLPPYSQSRATKDQEYYCTLCQTSKCNLTNGTFCRYSTTGREISVNVISIPYPYSTIPHQDSTILGACVVVIQLYQGSTILGDCVVVIQL